MTHKCTNQSLPDNNTKEHTKVGAIKLPCTEPAISFPKSTKLQLEVGSYSNPAVPLSAHGRLLITTSLGENYFIDWHPAYCCV